MRQAVRHEVNLSAARNEYQSFQIVVNGASERPEQRECEDLGPGGDRLEK